MTNWRAATPERAPTAVVVERHPDIRRDCRLSLERAGFSVSEAEGGESALQVIRTIVPDVVVAELTQEGTGVEFCRAIRADAGRRIAVVILSDVPGDAAQALVRDSSPDAVVTMPIDASCVAAVCRTLVARKSPQSHRA